MKNIKYTIFTIFLFLVCIINPLADCTEEERKHFKEIEDEYTITYELDSNKETYTIYLTMPEPEKYMYTITSKQEDFGMEFIDDKSFKLTKVLPGKLNFDIVGVTATCDEVLKETSLTLTKYNVYTDDPLCQGYEDFVLCDKEYSKELTREEFESRLETYKNSLEKEGNNKPKEEENKDIKDKIIDYIKDNKINLIIILIIIMLAISTLVIIKDTKKRGRLE